MISVHPYVHFQNNMCKEAMNFYKECLGGEVKMQTVKETGMLEHWKDAPAGVENKIMHASLTKDGKALVMGADMMMPETFKIGDTVTLSINLDNEQEARDIYAKLSAGGKIQRELQIEFWGDLFASFTDKYGIDWMINCEMPKKA